MLQTVKKGSSLHVVGEAAVRIGEAAPASGPCDARERPLDKAWRVVERLGIALATGAAAAGIGKK
ncbi:hypothetical protein [Burkholderia stabilis]|uniref:hypothetical protein n=1 Tax=Burkholderia stabilis TaxID=95485 RepID=UPI001F4AE73E|nr:hypothetical protein [Burkholderia stabilis]HDR9584742.1 hypothetical protein [Burkholderia stabilis]HDR9648302.1 hypothetical protein [Burkholderia stabilis]HDR9655824.1 hypothetical protein [Burkholderia stabilis]HDR9679149.1 hypothetical protein [Burkholderia stabilis]